MVYFLASVYPSSPAGLRRDEHLYILSTQRHAIEEVRPLAYAKASTLILLAFLLNLTAFGRGHGSGVKDHRFG